MKGSMSFDDVPSDDGDELYDDAVQVVVEAKKASASLLQRRLKVGYARAARLLDIMEEKSVIGPGDGAKPREVFLENTTPASTPASFQSDSQTDARQDDENSTI